jgi:hypothetical protein
MTRGFRDGFQSQYRLEESGQSYNQRVNILLKVTVIAVSRTPASMLLFEENKGWDTFVDISNVATFAPSTSRTHRLGVIF